MIDYQKITPIKNNDTIDIQLLLKQKYFIYYKYPHPEDFTDIYTVHMYYPNFIIDFYQKYPNKVYQFLLEKFIDYKYNSYHELDHLIEILFKLKIIVETLDCKPNYNCKSNYDLYSNDTNTISKYSSISQPFYLCKGHNIITIRCSSVCKTCDNIFCGCSGSDKYHCCCYSFVFPDKTTKILTYTDTN